MTLSERTPLIPWMSCGPYEKASVDLSICSASAGLNCSGDVSRTLAATVVTILPEDTRPASQRPAMLLKLYYRPGKQLHGAQRGGLLEPPDRRGPLARAFQRGPEAGQPCQCGTVLTLIEHGSGLAKYGRLSGYEEVRRLSIQTPVCPKGIAVSDSKPQTEAVLRAFEREVKLVRASPTCSLTGANPWVHAVVLAGAGVVNVDGDETELAAGDLVAIKPATYRTVRSYDWAGDLEMLVFSMHTPLVRGRGPLRKGAA